MERTNGDILCGLLLDEIYKELWSLDYTRGFMSHHYSTSSILAKYIVKNCAKTTRSSDQKKLEKKLADREKTNRSLDIDNKKLRAMNSVLTSSEVVGKPQKMPTVVIDQTQDETCRINNFHVNAFSWILIDIVSFVHKGSTPY